MTARKPSMTWDNGRIPFRFDPRGFLVSRLRRALSRSRRRPVPQPWVWERLATPEEIARLRQTDMRRAA